MGIQTILRREVRGCRVNKPVLKALAASQLGLAAALALFSTIIDPPILVIASVAGAVGIVEGVSVGIMIRYLRRGCFT
ncbi:hypothetical protein [Vulcanisaeta thermophila]|uniref:hypothetical protein n=1 Tax=Vulcanisaeta thermophila TaxID=867917 RepID=UPI000853A055|nr:hypothetical protein [Vulcanisaeta thermophila]